MKIVPDRVLLPDGCSINEAEIFRVLQTPGKVVTLELSSDSCLWWVSGIVKTF